MPRARGIQRSNYCCNSSGVSGVSGVSGSRFAALSDYRDEHTPRNQDARKKERNTIRRVSFKTYSAGITSRLAEMALRGRLEDDEDMECLATTSKFPKGIRRKGSPVPKGKFGQNRKLLPSSLGWYQVNITSNYTKEEIIRAILDAISPELFVPQYWYIDKNTAIFFLDDLATAQRLKSLVGKIQMPNGYPLHMRVRAGCPNVVINDAFKEQMKLVMAKRYNPHTKALDLSRFHADSDFKNTFCGLFKTPIMAAALQIIEKNIPDLEALNLNNNNLMTMESFRHIERRLPNLKILYLGENNLTSLAHLLVLRNVPMVELVLKSNPLCARYKDHSHYVSEVRRKFPKLIKLDGEFLQPQIQFDVHDSGVLPSAKASFLCDANGTDIIRQFLEQYFQIFDSENRQPLLDAYHEQAIMTITVPHASQAGRLNSFWKYNRNVRRNISTDEASKVRNPKVGRLAVVSTLAEWPKTQHDRQSFSVDLTLFTPRLIAFTVAGLFKELEAGNSNSGDIRYFQRQFVVVPAGGGFCIRNELIFVTNATGLQVRAFRKSAEVTLKPATPIAGGINNSSIAAAAAVAAAAVAATAMNNLQSRVQINQPVINSMPIVTSPTIPPSPALTANQQPDDSIKLQMVQALSSQSNMNLEWSKKCLEETQWNYQHATYAFDKLHKENKIPPEAFVK